MTCAVSFVLSFPVEEDRFSLPPPPDHPPPPLRRSTLDLMEHMREEIHHHGSQGKDRTENGIGWVEGVERDILSCNRLNFLVNN